MIDSLLAATHAAGLRPEGIDLAAFAMVRALGAHHEGATLHVAVGGVVNLAVTRDGECVFTRVVGGGLEAMATELAEREMISIEEARAALASVRLDVEPPAPQPEPVVDLEPDEEPGEADEPVLFFAAPPPKPTLVDEPEPEPVTAPPAPAATEDRLATEARTVVTDGLRRIAGEVRNSIDFHLTSTADDDAAVQRVLLTGAALAVPGFAEELSRRLSLPVVAADVEGASVAGAFAVAAGLAVEELAA
jgi:Tfp pilus assembly PilM family ATPase